MTEPPGGVHHVDIGAGAAYLASGIGGVIVLFQVAWPNQATQITAIGALIALFAGLLARLFANPTGKPATSIVAGAPIVQPPPPPEQVKETHP